MTPEKWRFGLGVILVTPGALSLLPRRDLEGLLDRHAGGDWGDVCQSDAMANDDYALGHGGRLLSPYETPAGGYGSSPSRPLRDHGPLARGVLMRCEGCDAEAPALKTVR